MDPQKTYFVNNLRTAKYFLKHSGQPKRAWQGHYTSLGREDLLVLNNCLLALLWNMELKI